MTFDEYFTKAVERGFPADDAARRAAADAWDAALCAVTLEAFVRGAIKTPTQILSAASDLHSWK